MAVGSIIQRLTPISLLAALLYAPPQVLERFLGVAFTRGKWPGILKPLLRALIGLGLLRTANAGLNALATNNWRLSSTPPGGAWDWPNEIAVVTGGCSGIGLALVKGLTAKGVRVAVLDVQSPPDSLTANARVTFIECDVTSLDAVMEAAKTVRERLGADPTVLINNAGVVRAAPILEVPERDVRLVLHVNLLASWLTVKAFLPAMVKRNKGHVVTIASVGSYITLPTSTEYMASKAGVLAFHEGLSSEIRQIYQAPGVVTSIVHPSFVSTPMTAPHAAQIERMEAMMTTDDVARPVLAQIFSGRGAQVFVPRSMTFLSTVKGWPNWMQEGFRDFLAIQAKP